MPKATVDRFEEGLAVLVVDGRQVTRPRAELAPEVREGDVIDLDTGKVDAQATEALREEVRKARKRAKKKQAPPGNFDL
ncbi:MAG: DUF3006 domain-containing protein [Hyalangium sp.]|uniref:DUF3006 domain-containing protein n=1 Tax=Hyalangium sp. TaxID=2028555 RepID=UPI003899A785